MHLFVLHPRPHSASLLAPAGTLWRASYYPKLRGSLIPLSPPPAPPPRENQATTLFVESCGIISIKLPLHMHMPYKSTLPTPSCLLPHIHTHYFFICYLFISFRLVGWFFFFSFQKKKKNFVFGVLEVGGICFSSTSVACAICPKCEPITK